MRILVAALAAGIVAIVAGSALGGAGALMEAIAKPPVIVRAALVGVSTVVAVGLLTRAVSALASGNDAERDIMTMIRGVRLAFLAVAAGAVAAGWFVGHPLLLVVGIVIAGVDVVETTILQIVATSQRHGSSDG